MRSLAAIILAALGLLLTIPASVSGWQERTIYDEDEFVSTVEGALGQDQVQEALARRLTETIVEQTEIQDRIGTLLETLEEEGPEGIPEGVALLEGPLTRVASEAIYRAVLRVLEAPAAEQALDTALRSMHRSLTALIDDEIELLETDGNKVVLNLRSILEDAIKDIGGERGERFLQRIDLDEDAGKVVLFERSDGNTKATRLLFWWLKESWPVTPIVAIGLLVAAIFVARGRRRTLIGVGAGLAVITAVTVFAVSLAGNVAAEALAQRPDGKEAIESVYDEIVNGFVRQQAFIVLLGVAMAGGGWLAGEPRLLRAIRAQVFGKTEEFDLRVWVEDHIQVARSVGLVGGALLLIVWPDPGTRLVLTVFALVAAYLLVLSLIVSDAAWAEDIRRRLADFRARYLQEPPGAEGRGFLANWVARRAAAIRIAVIAGGIIFLLVWPEVRFSTVVAVGIAGLLLLAAVDALAGRANREKEGPDGSG